MVQLPTIVEMLKSGMHFGHKVSKWHPKMKPFIFGEKNGVHIIDLEKTVIKFNEAIEFIKDIIAKDGTILFVGTKQQAKVFVKEESVRCQTPYIHERWLGGLLTNFAMVHKLVDKLKKLRQQKDSGVLEKYTKKEQLMFAKEIDRLESFVGGIESLDTVPDAIFVVDVKTEKTAIREAQAMNIPIIAICDTNVNPTYIDYVIPANDDAVQALQLSLRVIADAVLEAKKLAEEAKAIARNVEKK